MTLYDRRIVDEKLGGVTDLAEPEAQAEGEREAPD